MTTADIQAESGRESRSDTPLASQLSHTPPTETPPSSVEPISRPMSPLQNHVLLPMPSTSSNGVQPTFTYPNTTDDIASADISIAPDGSFVETSSGPAARELKRRYDQHFGVGKDVRSPYAITAFVNQHGKPMFRVGHRDLSAPAAQAAEVEESKLSVSPESRQRTKRRSRMSVHALPHMFRNGSASVSSSTSSRPQTATGPPRKLRKTRSIPDELGVRVRESVARGHSNSVTAADIPVFGGGLQVPSSHQRPKPGDMFAEVMDWTPPRTSSSGYSTHSLFLPGDEPSVPDRFLPMIPHPFGPGVCFDTPSRRTGVEYLRTPRLLREMQSFESGLTARQSETEDKTNRISLASTSTREFGGLTRPASAIRLRDSVLMPDSVPPSPSLPPPVVEEVEETWGPCPETAVYSRYSPDVFDVLQTYRGLPLLDKLADDAEDTTVIKLSLSADDTAAPRDDPRFVIWGEACVDRDDDRSVSQESFTDRSSSAHSSSISRRKSHKSPGKGRSSDVLPSLKLSTSSPQRILVAATIERWIAQLTSDLNYDEPLNFFLTYRTYISAVDLCHLLICRFHWALMKPNLAADEKVRKIVRVRTFVAFRYWLLTFFTVDFLPNRELRLWVASWLNALIRDPVLKRHSDGLSTVKKLRKVAKDCKRTHTRIPNRPKTPALTTPRKEEQLFGQKFAEATRKLGPVDEDSDVDLDFLLDTGDQSQDFHSGAHLSTIHLGGTISPSGTSAMPLTSLSILHQSDHAPGPATDLSNATPFVQTAATLPIHHSALSRVFVKTIGRLGRWKRVLNNRSSVRAPLGSCAAVSAFDLELSVSRDLLTVNGGVEQYLRIIESQQQPPVNGARDGPVFSPPAAPAALPSSSLSPSSSRRKSLNIRPASTTVSTVPPLPSPPPLPSLPVLNGKVSSPPSKVAPDLPPHYAECEDARESRPASTAPSDIDYTESEVEGSIRSPVQRPRRSSDQVSLARTSSTDSFGRPLSSVRQFQSPWQFDIVSIDELDLSDNSSEGGDGPSAPPGLRRPPRRLPLRRDFEFAPRPDSVSSMGITSHTSVASSNSVTSSTSESLAGLGGGNIQQWQMNALVDSLSDEEESGDVEAALRHLEGQLNPQKQKEKASKVDGWVRTMQERLAAGEFGDDLPRFSDDEDDEYDDDEGGDIGSPNPTSPASDVGDLMDPHNVQIPAGSESEDLADDESSNVESLNTPIPAHKTYHPPPGLSSPPRSSDAKPAPEAAVPIEILASRMSTSSTSPSPPWPSVTSKFAHPDPPRVHRSFIMSYRAEFLAQHFAMIDRELFMGIKFEELVLDDWAACEEVNVLDWAQYLKDRARWKAESRCPEKTSALAAVRARFNLIANFTVSEIVLSLPNERPHVVAKFLRIAWKSYCLHSYNTLVAIITGLQSDWVASAMRRYWGRIPMWETRVFNDLKQWTTNADNFRHIRQAIDTIIDAKPLETSSHAPSVVSGGGDPASGRGKPSAEHKMPTPSACVPFVGVYLSQLSQHNRLPDLIDPTAPNEVVSIDPDTANFDAPAHPEVFATLAPLPPSMVLEPLINVHKQRLIAGVIKALVAGQHLASHVQFPVDKRLFQKCLRLRGLDSETIQRALGMYPD